MHAAAAPPSTEQVILVGDPGALNVSVTGDGTVEPGVGEVIVTGGGHPTVKVTTADPVPAAFVALTTIVCEPLGDADF